MLPCELTEIEGMQPSIYHSGLMVQESEQFPDLLDGEGPANIVKEASMKRALLFVLGALVAMGAIVGWLVYANWDTAVDLVSMAVNYVKRLNAPAGTTF